MANDVKVVIELSRPMPKLGFGIPLILASMQNKAVEYTEVKNLEAVQTAGFDEKSEVYAVAKLVFSQNDAPEKIAICASAEQTVSALPKILDNDWRQLIVIAGESDSTVSEISEYIEGIKKPAMYFVSVDPTKDSAVIAAIKGNDRTYMVAYTSQDVSCPEAAIVGATAGLEVGSFTYKNMILKGVTAQTYTDNEIDNLHQQNVNTILKKAGSVVTSDGLSASGEFTDIVDTKDYIIQQIEYQCQYLLNRVPKLPYDNRGIAALEGVVVSVLKDAANNGMIAVTDEGDYDYSVSFGKRSDCDPYDISARHYAEGTFEFTLAGAIHTAKIKGTIVA